VPDSIRSVDLRTIAAIVAIAGTVLAIVVSLRTAAFASGVQAARIDAIEAASEDHQEELERRLGVLEEQVEPMGPSLARIEATVTSIDRRLERLEEER